MTDKNGELPKGWKWVKLGDCVQLINGRAYSQHELLDKGTPVIRIQNLNGGENWYYSDLELPPEKYCQKGDLLFAWSTTFGAYFWNGEKAIFHYHIWNVVPNETLDKQFAFYLLERITNDIKATSHGASMLHVTKGAVEKWLIPLPPLPEQKRIVAILNEQMAAVEKARAAAEAQLQAAKTLPAAYLREVFDSPEAQKWERKKLGEVCNKITDGTHQSPPFTSKGIPFIFVRNIVSGTIDFNITNFVSEETYTELTKRCRPEYGDLLYSAVGSFGVAVVIETTQPFTFQRHIALLKPKKDEIYSPFLASYINSPKGMKQSDELAFGGGQRTVTLKSLSSFEVPIPSLDKQKHIYSLLSSKIKETQQLQRSLQDQLDTIKQLPAALLRQAFNGEL